MREFCSVKCFGDMGPVDIVIEMNEHGMPLVNSKMFLPEYLLVHHNLRFWKCIDGTYNDSD